MPPEQDIRLVYDRECPVCSFYSRKIDVAEGELSRVNAREHSELVDEISAAGYDLDEGMVLKVDDRMLFGSDAIHELALRSSGKGAFNRCTSGVFRHPRIARFVYPLLTACRRLLLRILGRSRINSVE